MRRESGYYPAGAEYDPRAPWNQPDPEPEESEIAVKITTTLTKKSTITTYDAVKELWVDIDVDDEGHIYKERGYDINYSRCNFVKDYADQEYTIPELLDILKDYIQGDLKTALPKSSTFYRLSNILNSIDGWKEESLEVTNT